MADNRRGLNARLSYSKGGKGPLRVFRARVDVITHGTKMIGDESQARTKRAYYPHRSAEDQFTINVICKGYEERKSLTDYLDRYASFVLDPDLAVGDFPPMIVSVPSRNFVRTGVPITGYDYGDHVGSMVFNHSITFESVPSQLGVNDVSRPVYVEANKDINTEFFYPFTRQLSGNQTPDVYSTVSNAVTTILSDFENERRRDEGDR
jgi:hypothetical protein